MSLCGDFSPLKDRAQEGGTSDRIGDVVVGRRAAFETKATVQKTNVPSKSAVVGMSVEGGTEHDGG